MGALEKLDRVVQERRVVYPFAAIVGQEKAKLALLAVAVNPAIGGVLLVGDKGTGKSTMVRALADLLPEIEVSEGCPFNCNPRNPAEMCDECYRKYLSGSLKITLRKMRVVDLPLSITVDRLVGTLDIKRALTEGVRALQPGLLAEANRNILYIDEVNLLDDYVADVLLDAAAMGWNIVEREGVSVRHPARFILIGSMNPEEGELRPQILDRFGLYVKVEASMDPEERAEIVGRVEKFLRDPIAFYKKWEPEQQKLREAIKRAREIINDVIIDDDLVKLIAKTMVELGIRTHRAEIVIVRTAKALAALEGRTRVTMEDVKKAMELALPHRLKSKPFEPPRPPPQMSQRDQQPPEGQSRTSPSGQNTQNRQLSKGDKEPSGGGAKGEDRQIHAPAKPREEKFKAEDVNVEIATLFHRFRDMGGGLRGARRSLVTSIGHLHGVHISYIPPRRAEDLIDVDLTATIVTAALNNPALPLKVTEEDFRVRVRRRRAPLLRVVLLDSSGSMAVEKRIAVAKGLVSKLAESSYVNREYISLVVFRQFDAEVLVPPSRRYEEVIATLDHVPTGGRTPLPHALLQLYNLARAFKVKFRDGKVVGILITDGKGNVPLRSSVEEDVVNLSSALKRDGVEIEIYDTRPRMTIDPAPSYIELIAELTNARVFRVDMGVFDGLVKHFPHD